MATRAPRRPPAPPKSASLKAPIAPAGIKPGAKPQAAATTTTTTTTTTTPTPLPKPGAGKERPTRGGAHRIQIQTAAPREKSGLAVLDADKDDAMVALEREREEKEAAEIAAREKEEELKKKAMANSNTIFRVVRTDEEIKRRREFMLDDDVGRIARLLVILPGARLQNVPTEAMDRDQGVPVLSPVCCNVRFVLVGCPVELAAEDPRPRHVGAHCSRKGRLCLCRGQEC